MRMRRERGRIAYADLFWLFMAGSLLGIVIEGIFCIVDKGHWETHTVAVWGPFCILYGIGAALLYVISILMERQGKFAQFFAFMVVATIVEYLCGALLKYGLHMRAWDYSNKFLNIDGLVCLKFSVVWGVGGVMFSAWCVPRLRRLFEKMRGKGWRVFCACASVFMAVNLTVTAACILRWAERHAGVAPRDEVEQYIDETWDDVRMKQRFCEWRFIK